MTFGRSTAETLREVWAGEVLHETRTAELATAVPETTTRHSVAYTAEGNEWGDDGGQRAPRGRNKRLGFLPAACRRLFLRTLPGGQ